jgi:hypothetical protein
MCNVIQWYINPVLSADTSPYLVNIGIILIILKVFSYQNLRRKHIIVPGTNVFKLLNEMQTTLTQEFLCAFFLMASK